jgi:hypothetical protein
MERALGVRRGVLLLSMGLGSAVTPLLIHAWGARGTLIATGLDQGREEGSASAG